MKNTKTVVVDVQIQDMYCQFIRCMSDMFKDDFECFKNSYKSFCEVAFHLGTKNVVGIRKAFNDGYTCCLVPMDNIDNASVRVKPLELRIWNDDELLMVLTAREISY